MSEHLAEACRLYRAHLDAIDQFSIEHAQEREAALARERIAAGYQLDQFTKPTPTTEGTDNAHHA